MRLSNGDLRVFFRSDRAGGADLWSITVSPATGEAVGPPSAITADAAADHAPAPLLLPGDTLWLLYRSDRSVPSHGWPPGCCRRWRTASRRRSPTGMPRSRAVAQYPHSGHRHVATVRRSTSVVLSDAARIGRHRLWDDLLAYTPQQPLGPSSRRGITGRRSLHARHGGSVFKPGDSGHAFNQADG